MLSQFVNQMDEQLSNNPFKRRCWFRRWIVHMTIQPPLTKDYPLWKRSKDELRLLRLFNLTPEELGQKIACYWKKPRWRRWFASFGMNKKIDVWNYYRRCLAYQAVRPEKLVSRSRVIAKNELLLDELGLGLHQFNAKFEMYIEKRCHSLKWKEKNFLKEIKDYKLRLKETFLTKLNKSLKHIKTERDRFALKQQAEQEYQQVEALMLRYYYQWLSDFFSHRAQPNLVLELGIDVAQEGNTDNPERSIVMHYDSQAVSSSFQSNLPREENSQDGIGSLHGAKEWIQTQRERLKLLLEEGSLQKVEKLLKTSLNEIKTTTESYLDCYGTTLFEIQGQPEIYDAFLDYLDDLQRRLKPLLQGGILLFHPDHVMNLTHSQTMKELITRYSQIYLEQSRCYLDRFKNYHLRIEGFYQYSQQELQRKQSRRGRSDLARRIQKLDQAVKDLEQSYKEFAKKLNEFEAKRVQDKELMDVKLEESEAKRVQDKELMDAKLEESEAKRVQDKELMDAKLEESEAKRVQDKELMDAKLEESEAKRVQDKELMDAKLEESEAKRVQDKVESAAELAQHKAELDEKMKKITGFMEKQQSASTSSASDVTKSSNMHFFKH